MKDVFFLDGEHIATIQAAFLTDAPAPTDIPKSLRAAYSAYKKAHPVKRSKPEDAVSAAPMDLDEDSWRKSPNEFPGDEDSLIEEEATAAVEQ